MLWQGYGNVLTVIRGYLFNFNVLMQYKNNILADSYLYLIYYFPYKSYGRNMECHTPNKRTVVYISTKKMYARVLSIHPSNSIQNAPFFTFDVAHLQLQLLVAYSQICFSFNKLMPEVILKREHKKSFLNRSQFFLVAERDRGREGQYFKNSWLFHLAFPSESCSVNL